MGPHDEVHAVLAQGHPGLIRHDEAGRDGEKPHRLQGHRHGRLANGEEMKGVRLERKSFSPDLDLGPPDS
jgi:hypothetical protein